MRSRKIYVVIIKLIVDRIFALFFLILLFPFLLTISLVLFIHLRKSPFFKHTRIGKGERSFDLIKFRTMTIDFDESSTTSLGKLIRSFSIDELPQLLNIIKGDMSFVGPRPLLVEYLQYYNELEKTRHDVLPGITGWAQINGRNSIDWGRRMELDIYYVRNISFLLDMKILFKTVFEVLNRDMTSYKDEKTITFSEYASKR